MTVKSGYLTPLLHVRDIARSLSFYSLLGFETVDVDKSDDGTLGWARMHCEEGAIMFVPSEEPENAHHDRALFYLYTPDLPALAAQLVAAGVDVGPIGHPEYMPSGELCLSDPDGYIVLVGHWSSVEQDEWTRRVAAKRAAGLIPG